MGLMLALCDSFWTTHPVADFTVSEDIVLASSAARRIRLLVGNMRVALAI